MALATVPLALVAGLLPPPFSWLGWWLALALGLAAALAAAGTGPGDGAAVAAGAGAGVVGAGPSIGRGLSIAAGRSRTVVGAAVVALAGIAAVVVPSVLVASLLELGAFGGYLVVLTAFWIGARFVLLVPAIVVEDLGVVDAIDRSWDLAEGSIVELGAVAAGSAAFFGAAIVAAAGIAEVADLSHPVAVAGAALGCSAAGPLVAAGSARLLAPAEGRRRASDPAHGRA
jgi:hypothetical protein